MDSIRIRGARTHNLKNLNLDLPRHRLIVITGLSGSGKSSLAFDTLYAEGQRRYVESLSAYARQFLQLMDKPDVDLIEGLSPAISIEQKATSHNPRSTVGTVTEIHDYLRLLYARVGDPYCPDHPEQKLAAMTISQMVDATLALPETTRAAHDPRAGRRQPQGRASRAASSSCARRASCACASTARCTRSTRRPSSPRRTKHTIEVVVDRLKVRAEFKQRLAESYRDRAAPRRRPRDRRRDGHGMRDAEHLFSREVRVPDLQLFAGRARAAALLVQQPARRVPALRRPGLDHASSIPSASSRFRSCRWRPARSRAGTGATSSTSRCCRAWRSMSVFDVDRPFAKLA